MSKTPGSERRRGGGGGGGGDAKGETMVVNQQHDEAHSHGSDGDSLVSEESVMTNEDSEIAPQKNSAADRPAAKLAVESAARQRAGGAAAVPRPDCGLQRSARARRPRLSRGHRVPGVLGVRTRAPRVEHARACLLVEAPAAAQALVLEPVGHVPHLVRAGEQLSPLVVVDGDR